MDVCQNSDYCKEMAVVDRWLLERGSTVSLKKKMKLL